MDKVTGLSYNDRDNFNMEIETRDRFHTLSMRGGRLEIDDVDFEEEGSPETYALARVLAGVAYHAKLGTL
jgi:hypothetical protein